MLAVSAAPAFWLWAAGAGRTEPASGPAKNVPRSDVWGVFDVPANRRAFGALEALGVGWVRLQLPVGEPRAQRKLDLIAGKLPRLMGLGIGLWLTLYHRDPDNIIEAGTVGLAGSVRGGFPVADAGRFRNRIIMVTQRLAGAIAEAGGRPGDWLVLQAGNEVLPRDIAGGDLPARFWHGTGDQYMAMLAEMRDAVRAVDPAVPVALAGLSSDAMERVLTGDRRIGAWTERLIRDGRADWADVHLRHRLEDVPEKVAWVRARWSGRLAATEIAGPDPRVAPYSEAAQAVDLRARMMAARDAGADRLFWSGLVENPSVDPLHRREGLIAHDSWRRKPAFDAYRDIIAGG